MRLRKRIASLFGEFNEEFFKTKLKEKYAIYKQYRSIDSNLAPFRIGGGSMNGFYTISPDKNLEDLKYREIIQLKQHILDKISYFDNIDFEKLNTVDNSVVDVSGEETSAESVGNYKSALIQMASLVMDGFYLQQLGEDIKNKRKS